MQASSLWLWIQHFLTKENIELYKDSWQFFFCSQKTTQNGWSLTCAQSVLLSTQKCFSEWLSWHHLDRPTVPLKCLQDAGLAHVAAWWFCKLSKPWRGAQWQSSSWMCSCRPCRVEQLSLALYSPAVGWFHYYPFPLTELCNILLFLLTHSHSKLPQFLTTLTFQVNLTVAWHVWQSWDRPWHLLLGKGSHDGFLGEMLSRTN